jgi:hypothetical protein
LLLLQARSLLRFHNDRLLRVRNDARVGIGGKHDLLDR